MMAGIMEEQGNHLKAARCQAKSSGDGGAAGAGMWCAAHVAGCCCAPQAVAAARRQARAARQRAPYAQALTGAFSLRRHASAQQRRTRQQRSSRRRVLRAVLFAGPPLRPPLRAALLRCYRRGAARVTPAKARRAGAYGHAAVLRCAPQYAMSCCRVALAARHASGCFAEVKRRLPLCCLQASPPLSATQRSMAKRYIPGACLPQRWRERVRTTRITRTEY